MKARTVSISVGDRPKPYKLLRSILAPIKPGEKEYKDLVEALQKQLPETVGNHLEVQVLHSCEEGERVSSHLRC